ncbi:hypothetical protein [Selenihalanaerobacter shriftii]|uniref:Uncharacterized protein n=1 Tax=Selenihalanaerobacter shriftii TaxID=142842 RepID=A0A1T4JN82_9FIRM|nr:hypothetical protein [Selenihalanaerobacter shriftii]SJZ31619.1 hypothetical protein SAMN02745118_00254 [Selenihalanaerobacter shriftii]
MKKSLLILLMVAVMITLMTTLVFASSPKSVEDMVKQNKGCAVSCHKPDSKYNLKNEIKAMAKEGKHADVSSMVSNEGPEKCMTCHSSNFGKILHEVHLVGTPEENHFLADVKSGTAGCVSCHALDAETGEIGLD